MKMEQAKHMLETADHGTVDNPFDFAETESEYGTPIKILVVGYGLLILAIVLTVQLVWGALSKTEHTCDDPACTSNIVTNNITGTSSD
mgnify:CR=1 FL=1|jgi:hypothetical protein